MKKRKCIFIVPIILLIVLIVIIASNSSSGLKSVKSEKQLERIYDGYIETGMKENLIGFLTMPISFFNNGNNIKRRVIRAIDMYENFDYDYSIPQSYSGATTDALYSPTKNYGIANNATEYSTTNIQVENVDEADINKTDGQYIYSISEGNVVITNVIEPTNIKIASKITIAEGIPEDLILYNNKLVVISKSLTNNDTLVEVYNIDNKEKPNREKEYILYEPYYTSRCINNKLYVIANGSLRKEDGKIITYYSENNNQKNIQLKDIKYFSDIRTKKQTLISMLNLDDMTQDVNVKSYLIDISNAYISQNSIYLLDYKYSNDNKIKISSLFTLKGIFGVDEDENDYKNRTEIYKFDIKENGKIEYNTKAKTEGKVINQFSLDEFNENLRVALYDNEGSRIVVFDEKLKEIGRTPNLAKGENMYSSRFIGNRAYLVTYKTIDPLYVINLSEPTKPEVLGKLKIPGYSTYLHPYDENHLIGIGMETEETINRNSSGKVTNTFSRIVGMKMALFDVSNVSQPIEISKTVIGDSRATSSILTNHKALLFSKEKQLIAIPINNYKEDFEINSSNNMQDMINSYTNYSKRYISEGYWVYNINLEEGFKLKGVINHEKNNIAQYSYYSNTKLLRGLYINNNLFTVSENMIKVNKLDNLELINELKIK